MEGLQNYQSVGKTLLNKWIKEGQKLGESYLIITVSDTYPLKFQPVYVRSRSDLFNTISTYHYLQNCNVVEVYNLTCDLSPQVEKELYTDLNLDIFKQNELPVEYSAWKLEIEELPIRPDDCLPLSQFDLESWFYRGQKGGKTYMVVVCQESIYKEYYPIYADKMNLFDTVTTYQKRDYISVCEVYNLWYDFKKQYMGRQCSIFLQPEHFFNEREEKLHLLFGDPYYDGVRRRIWDYLIESSLEDKTPGSETYQTAFELMDYCSNAEDDQVKTMRSLILKAMELFPFEGNCNTKAQPFYVIYNNLIAPQWSASASGRIMRSFIPVDRDFALTCLHYASEKVHCDILLDLIPFYLDFDYDIRILLLSYWRYSGKVSEKKKQVREWMKHRNISEDNLRELKYSLSSGYNPKPFNDHLLWHSINNQIWYINGEKEDLFKHNDPDPVLTNSAELALTYERAEKGDLISQLVLGAAYLNGISVAENRDEGLKWLKLAAVAQHPSAYLLLGDAYIRDNTAEKDFRKAIRYYQLAADRGYAQAFYNLAEQYRQGYAIKQDFIKALAYYLAANEFLIDIEDTLEDHIANLKSILSKANIGKAEQMAVKIKATFIQPEYEPLKYMYYFNPKGVQAYWTRRYL
jgi:hypothetical protein